MVEVVAIVVDDDDDATLAARSSRCTVIHNNICLSRREERGWTESLVVEAVHAGSLLWRKRVRRC
jgi:hypothetical protein